MDYGEKICRLRKSKGMTQEELGKVLNVTYQAVSKWERGESLPDFSTMSQIAKFFQVPLSYFEDGGETRQETAAHTEAAGTLNASDNIIGVCTVCGKMLKEGEEHCLSPKIICKGCAQRQERETKNAMEAEERRRRYAAERDKKMQLGSGFDVKLIVSILLAVAAYAGMTVFCFLCDTYDREFAALLTFLVPLAVFGCTHAVFGFIDELRDKDDGPDGYTRNLSLIVGALFSIVNIALFLTLYLSFGNEPYYLVILAVGAVLSFTFVSQFLWGSVVREIFTCGGFTFKLPGVIFSLTPDSIILMIITKLFLGVIAIIVFIVTTVIVAVVAIAGSFFTFIPCVIYKTVTDKKA